MPLFLPTQGCCFPPSPWWHTLGSKVGPPYLSGKKRRRGGILYASEYPLGWVKKVKVVNLPVPAKKGSVTRTVKPKFAKRGDDSSETYSDIIPYGGGLPPIGNIVLESSPPPFPSALTYSS